MLKWVKQIALILVGVIFIPMAVDAQTKANAILSSLNTDQFPKISAYLDVYDQNGDFLHNLTADAITLLEDGKPVPIDELTQIENGTQFVVAYNLGPTFAIRDVNGISRQDVMKEVLSNWANQHTNQNDDLSFITNDGPEFTHLPNARQWMTGIESYTTDARNAIPSLDVLVRAIDVAADPAPRVGMGRAILLLTPPPDRAGAATIQSILSLAQENQVRIFVWMVSSPAYFESEGAKQLAELARQTGGAFIGYSGEEELPNIEAYIEPMRYIYALGYTSQIRNAEPHQISVVVQKDRLQIRGEPLQFELEVLPPNPIFIAPPLQIFRANRAAFGEALAEETNYTPKTQTIEILIEFPDRRARPLTRTTLYVDDEIAAENTAPPFDQFSWNLEAYTTSGEHTIRAEVFDSYGLSGISIENTVQVTIQQTPQNIVSTIAKNGTVIASAAAALAGGILILVLIIGGRIRPRNFGPKKRKVKKPKPAKAKTDDPVVQPIKLPPLPSRSRIADWKKFIPWQAATAKKQAPLAFLEPLDSAPLKNRLSQQIPIPFGETIIGSEPVASTILLDDPAIEAQHAKIRAHNQGGIYLFRQEKTSRIWLNYKPIESDNIQLAHGDILHFGVSGFRLILNNPQLIPQPVIQQERVS